MRTRVYEVRLNVKKEGNCKVAELLTLRTGLGHEDEPRWRLDYYNEYPNATTDEEIYRDVLEHATVLRVLKT